MMVKIFVYGTLMRGEKAAQMLAEGNYIGDYVLNDYAMYDLGAFPGIREKAGEKVFGEVFEIPESLIPRLDSYEGEGYLYRRAAVSVENENSSLDNVLAYVYLGECEGKIVRRKWGTEYN